MDKNTEPNNANLNTEDISREAHISCEESGWFNPIEQGMYDDDPSPYDGNYSEM